MSELSPGIKEVQARLGVQEDEPAAPPEEQKPQVEPEQSPEPEEEIDPFAAPPEPEPEPAPEEPEEELPEWAQTEDGKPVYQNEQEWEVANYLAGGAKPEWYYKGYDKFTEDEKAAFGKIHSVHDKWKQQQGKATEEPHQPEPVETDAMKEARERLEYIEKNNPKLYKELQSMLDDDMPAPTSDAPSIDINALKKNYADAILEGDPEKIKETFDEMTTAIEGNVVNKVNKMLDERDQQRTQEEREREWKRTVKTWNDEIDEIRRSGDRRIDEFIEVGSDGTHTIARLLVHGDTITGFKPKNVYEAYRFLLEGGRNSRNGSALRRPDFGALNPPQGNFNESEVSPERSDMSRKNRLDWMRDWPGWKT